MKTITIRAFTKAYFPFIMGGDVWQTIAATIQAKGPYKLGKGFEGYLAENPKQPGETHVIEKTSGAFIGTTIAEVKKDIAACKNITIMKQQVKKAIQQSKSCYKELTTDEFWNHKFN